MKYHVIFKGEKQTEEPMTLNQATSKVKAITSDVLSMFHFMGKTPTIDLNELDIVEAEEDFVGFPEFLSVPKFVVSKPTHPNDPPQNHSKHTADSDRYIPSPRFKQYEENYYKQCECGKEKHGFFAHSQWCPKHEA